MSGGCGSIGFNAGQLTRTDSRMKVSLTGLPDTLRAVAWPSSARTLRRALKCVNERDPRYQLLLYLLSTSTLIGPLLLKQRKEWATVGPYGADALGYTRPTMVRTMRCNSERRS